MEGTLDCVVVGLISSGHDFFSSSYLLFDRVLFCCLKSTLSALLFVYLENG